MWCCNDWYKTCLLIVLVACVSHAAADPPVPPLPTDQEPDAQLVKQWERASKRAESEVSKFAAAVERNRKGVGTVEQRLAKLRAERDQSKEAAGTKQDDAEKNPSGDGDAADSSKLQELADVEAIETEIQSTEKRRQRMQAELEEAERAATVARERLESFRTKPRPPQPASIRLMRKYVQEFPTYSCRIDPSGRYIASGPHDFRLRRFDFFTGEKTLLEGHRSWVRRLTFHPDSGELLTIGYEGLLAWWDLSEEQPVPKRTVDAHRGFGRAIAVSPDGSLIATGGNDAVVRIWSADDGRKVKELEGHQTQVYNVRFHPQEEALVTADLDGVMKQWSLEDWKMVREFDGKVFKHTLGGVRGLEFSPDGQFLVACGVTKQGNSLAGDGQPGALLFDWTTGEQVVEMQPPKKYRGPIWAIRFSPAGQFLVGTGGRTSGALWFWKIGEADSFFEFELPDIGYDLDFHADGYRLVAGTYDGAVQLYDLTPRCQSNDKQE